MAPQSEFWCWMIVAFEDRQLWTSRSYSSASVETAKMQLLVRQMDGLVLCFVRPLQRRDLQVGMLLYHLVCCGSKLECLGRHSSFDGFNMLAVMWITSDLSDPIWSLQMESDRSKSWKQHGHLAACPDVASFSLINHHQSCSINALGKNNIIFKTRQLL